MTLNFSIEYRTEWGQNVEVELSLLSTGGKTNRQRIPLETDDGLIWKGMCTLHSRAKQLRYTYIITNPSLQSAGGDGVVRREWDVVPRLFPADNARTYFFEDHWHDVPKASHCYTDAFRVANGLKKLPPSSVALFPRTFLFRVQVPGLAEGEKVAIVGDQPALGNWDVDRALPMVPSAHGEWLLSISADGLRLPFQYKYIMVGKDGSVRWEEGENRETPSNSPFRGRTSGEESLPIEGEVWRGSGGWSTVNGQWLVALSDGEFRLEVPHWKVAGLVVPLFSLRSEGSQGVGDFGDLMQMVDWAAVVGMHAIQLLPIYDTTQDRSSTDSYPYNAISVHALHPIYIDLRRLPLADAKAAAEFRKKWEKLNELPALDYVAVIKLKEKYLHLYYEEQKSRPEVAEAYRAFAEENAEWLLPYSVFCHLRDKAGTPFFSTWKKLSSYNRSAVTKYADSHSDEVGYYSFVQFLLHTQLAQAADYAHSQRVFLKGDLPIGISPRSVEAWHEPHLFHTNMSAGAPPDDFSHTGQNWGFPTYDWERMAADGYLWWKQRLGGMARYFRAYRIDHILVFFRIWQIPKGSPTALFGQFSPALPLSISEIEAFGMHFEPGLFVPDSTHPDLYHPRISPFDDEVWLRLSRYEQNAFVRLYEDFFYRRHNDFWASQAMKKLPALIEATDMLVCGEDLGMVPACVGPVMQQLGILSLEIQAMPKAYSVEFADLRQNPYRSVDTVFTHDMPTLRLWWTENPQRRQSYYNNVLEHDGDAPQDLSGWLCEEVLARHLDSPSMLCLVSLQDWLSIDEGLRSPNIEAERINVPANPRHYWRYRMHLPISKLMEAKTLNERIRRLVERSDRL